MGLRITMGTLKKIIGLSVAALLLVCVTIGGVWAYTTDTENSASNQIAAGTFDMVPSTSGTATANYTVTPGGNNVNGYVVFTRLLPGWSGSITWTLSNNGTFPGTLAISCNVTFSDVSQNEVEAAVAGNNGGGNGDIDEYVGVRVKRDGTYFLGSASYYVPFSGLQAALNAQSPTISAGGNTVYVLEWAVASDIKGAGVDGNFGTIDDSPDVNENIIQSDRAQIDITFTLNQ